jgi:hypothetical protein
MSTRFRHALIFRYHCARVGTGSKSGPAGPSTNTAAPRRRTHAARTARRSQPCMLHCEWQREPVAAARRAASSGRTTVPIMPFSSAWNRAASSRYCWQAFFLYSRSCRRMYLRCKWCVQSRWVGRYGGLGGSGNARVWADDVADSVVCGVLIALAANGRSTTLTTKSKLLVLVWLAR